MIPESSGDVYDRSQQPAHGETLFELGNACSAFEQELSFLIIDLVLILLRGRWNYDLCQEIFLLRRWVWGECL